MVIVVTDTFRPSRYHVYDVGNGLPRSPITQVNVTAFSTYTGDGEIDIEIGATLSIGTSEVVSLTRIMIIYDIYILHLYV